MTFSLHRKLDLEKIMKNMALNVLGDFGELTNKKPIICKHAKMQSIHRDDLSDRLIHFHVASADLGALHKIKLSYEHKDLKRAESWFLKYIQIFYDKQEFYFACKKWIKVDKEQRKVDLNLFELVSIPFFYFVK
jgi:hypothetical protein